MPTSIPRKWSRNAWNICLPLGKKPLPGPLAWRTLEVEGGDLVKVTLPEPYAVSSRFQNIPVAPESYYEDIAVMAVRFPDTRRSLAQLGARVSASGGTFSVEELT